MKKALRILNDPKLLNALKQLMWKAADSILEVYTSDNFKFESKNDSSPVTEADLNAHKILLRALNTLTPDIPVVSEEDISSLSIPANTKTFWLIDPLDGTKEFLKRNGEFTCNVALIEFGKPTLGFVGVPAKQELYVGGNKLGSTKEDLNAEPITITHNRIRDDVTRVMASKSHLNSETQNYIDSIKGKVELVQAGSSLKIIKIATGEADIYPRLAPTCEWDTAAAQAILEGAGGMVLQENGCPLVYGKEDILNPSFIAKANDC